jgi:tetratricopeptide (TPR) repeat protein
VAALSDYSCVEVFVEDDKKSFEKYGVKSLPTLMFLTADGAEIGRFTGHKPPDEFVKAVEECSRSLDNIDEGQKRLSENPEDAEGLYLCAVGYLYQDGGIEKMFANLDKLVQLKPTNDNRAFICKGLRILSDNIARRPGRVAPRNKEAAQAEFQTPLLRIIEIDPDNRCGETVRALYKAGLIELAKSGTCKDYFEKARKLDPDDKCGYEDDMELVEAGAPCRDGDYAKAAGNLSGFIERNSDSELVPKALLLLASCLYRTKESEKYVQTLEKLVTEYPRSTEAKSARRLLERAKK